MSEPRPLGPASMIRLVAAREISARIRDKNFLISSLVIVLVLVGVIGAQVALSSGGEGVRVGVVGGPAELEGGLAERGTAFGIDVEVVELADEDAGRAAIEDGDVDGVLLAGDDPELLVEQSAGSSLRSVVQGAVVQLALNEQLVQAGVDGLVIPDVVVRALDPDADVDGQRVVIAIISVGVLYSLLILFGQFIAQGVVEEKSSRVVELLLATMRPWQLLAGKILGLGVLGLGQIVLIAAVGVIGALSFDLVDIPGELIGAALAVVAWFVVGYAFYAAIFAVAASLVTRQEDLSTVVLPTTLVLIGAFVVGLQGASDPGGTLARITSFVPGLSPLVMPVRQAAGTAEVWEVAVAVVLMLIATAVIVRIGGRIYAGALLRTGGRTTIREALRTERV